MGKPLCIDVTTVRLALLALVAFAVLAALPASSSAHIYWAYYGSGDATDGTVGKANLDGTGADKDFIAGEAAAGSPYGLAVDGDHLYWANLGAGTIGRSNLDGAGVDQDFISVAGGVGGARPYDVAVGAGHIYWSNYSAETIGRANLDGTGVDQDFIASSGSPLGVAVDDSHIYWSHRPSLVGAEPARVGRANLDGGHIDQTLFTTTGSPGRIAVDANHIYWPGFGGIGRANVDGTGVIDIFIHAVDVTGIAVDRGHIYWSSLWPHTPPTSGAGRLPPLTPTQGTIGRADLDGSAADPSFMTVIGEPHDVAVGPQALASGDPGSLVFGSLMLTPQGTTSAPKTVTYTNSGTGDLVVRGFVSRSQRG